MEPPEGDGAAGGKKARDRVVVAGLGGVGELVECWVRPTTIYLNIITRCIIINIIISTRLLTRVKSLRITSVEQSRMNKVLGQPNNSTLFRRHCACL